MEIAIWTRRQHRRPARETPVPRGGRPRPPPQASPAWHVRCILVRMRIVTGPTTHPTTDELFAPSPASDPQVRPPPVCGSAPSSPSFPRAGEAELYRHETATLRRALCDLDAARRRAEATVQAPDAHRRALGLLQEAEVRLSALTGGAAPPGAGELWVDPKFVGRSARAALLANAPVAGPAEGPPPPAEALFSGGRELRLLGPSGQFHTVGTASAYREAVARQRSAEGAPVTDGTPIAVALVLEGGGGCGKRYAPALNELLRLGVVPTSVNGASAGAIAAALVAAGADPVALDALARDPALGALYDLHLGPDRGGVLQGQRVYELVDERLRELTGVRDRPVTFADLRMPLRIVATAMADTAPTGDLTTPEGRLFVFSSEATPRTPVALAVRASMAIPGVFEPVTVVDPTTGREVHLVDGGVLDNLPMPPERDGRPRFGLSVVDPGEQLAAGANVGAPRPLPSGPLNVLTTVRNLQLGLGVLDDSARTAGDYRDRTAPAAGDFMLALPTWNLKAPREGNSLLGFARQERVDGPLDVQTRIIARDFVVASLTRLRNPASSATNTPGISPSEDLRFQVDVTAGGSVWQATYAGGDYVSFAPADGPAKVVYVGAAAARRLAADHRTFGDGEARLQQALEDFLGWHEPAALRPR